MNPPDLQALLDRFEQSKFETESLPEPDVMQLQYRTGWNAAIHYVVDACLEQAMRSADVLRDALVGLLEAFPELQWSYASPLQQLALRKALALV